MNAPRDDRVVSHPARLDNGGTDDGPQFFRSQWDAVINELSVLADFRRFKGLNPFC
jgi:hypothetical protein